ncbi:HNH endonuclease, partial [Novosphingobium resinovorum]|uniref:HNH endonuclease n=1 Tax=Novosphingobium resinovorum TaxID=158500 RepID=UPI0022F26EFE
MAEISEDGESYLTGEMAHIVARQAEGPRGDGVGGDNSYENLILLCPTCHTRIDKAPNDFPVALLQKWKADHEAWVDSWSAVNNAMFVSATGRLRP